MPDRHVPVMLDQCLDLLEPALDEHRPGRPGTQSGFALVVDATLGLGGHTQAMLARWPHVRVLGIDRDPHALSLASQRLAEFGDRFRAVRATYDQLPQVLASQGRRTAQGVLFDLGVSSMQLDEPQRGFSYARDAPLDMRMDPDDELTAQIVVNTYDQAALTRLLREYGEERSAGRIARAIVTARAREPITGTAQLAQIVSSAIPAPARLTGGNPAKRSFQALRIEVNGELEVLRRAIPAAIDALAVGGRMVVLSYHSLEDRIVKQAIQAVTQVDLPPGLPVIPEHLTPTARVLTRGAVKASEDEVARNQRAASARMRGVQRLRRGAQGAASPG